MLKDAFLICLGTGIESADLPSDLFKGGEQIASIFAPHLSIRATLPVEQVVRRRTRRREIIALGEAPVDLTAAELECLRKVATVDDLLHWQDEVPGIWTVLLVTSGRLFIRTDLMRNAMIYATKVAGGVMLANRPEVIRGETDGVSSALCSLSMLYPGAPWPVDHGDLRGDLRCFEPGCVYEVSAKGWHKQRERVLPDAKLKLSQGSSLLTDALLASTNRTRAAVLGADLSGGYDSTTLCFLLDAAGKTYQTFSGVGRNRACEDALWSNKALQALKYAQPHYWNPSETPACFTPDPYRSVIPFAGVAYAAKIRWHAKRAKAMGVDVLIGGHGGDELLDVDETTVFHTWKTHPLTTWRNIKIYSANYRWSKRQIIRELFKPSPPLEKIRSYFDRSREKPDTLSYSPNIWGLSRWYAPPWLKDDALEAATTFSLEQWKKNDLPPTWEGRYHEIVSDSASTSRHLRWIYGEEAVTLRCPYLDESVFRATCSLAPAPLADPTSPKKALVYAMQGLVPGFLYKRRTKDVGLPDVYSGWEVNKERLAAEVSSWNLSEEGLVDASLLQRFIGRTAGQPIEPIALWRTLATERAIRKE